MAESWVPVTHRVVQDACSRGALEDALEATAVVQDAGVREDEVVTVIYYLTILTIILPLLCVTPHRLVVVSQWAMGACSYLLSADQAQKRSVVPRTSLNRHLHDMRIA